MAIEWTNAETAEEALKKAQGQAPAPGGEDIQSLRRDLEAVKAEVRQKDQEVEMQKATIEALVSELNGLI